MAFLEMFTSSRLPSNPFDRSVSYFTLGAAPWGLERRVGRPFDDIETAKTIVAWTPVEMAFIRCSRPPPKARMLSENW